VRGTSAARRPPPPPARPSLLVAAAAALAVLAYGCSRATAADEAAAGGVTVLRRGAHGQYRRGAASFEQTDLEELVLVGAAGGAGDEAEWARKVPTDACNAHGQAGSLAPPWDRVELAPWWLHDSRDGAMAMSRGAGGAAEAQAPLMRPGATMGVVVAGGAMRDAAHIDPAALPPLHRLARAAERAEAAERAGRKGSLKDELAKLPSASRAAKGEGIVTPATLEDKIVLASPGTTATRSVSAILQQVATGVHWDYRSEGGGGLPSVPDNLKEMRGVFHALICSYYHAERCVDPVPGLATSNRVMGAGDSFPADPTSCAAHALAPRLEAALRAALASDAHHVSDVPWHFFMEDVLALAPEARVLQTLRQPLEWAEKRVKGHGHDLVCKPDFVNGSASWFSLGDCLANAAAAGWGFASAAWETQKASTRRDARQLGEARKYEPIAAKIAHHNDYVTALAHAGLRRGARQLCVFDEGYAGLVGVRVGPNSSGYVIRDLTAVPRD